MVIVCVCPGCHNRLRGGRTAHVYFSALRAGHLRSGCRHGWGLVEPSSWPAGAVFSESSHGRGMERQGGTAGSLVSLRIRTLIAWAPRTHDLICARPPPRGPSSHTITLGARASACGFGEDAVSFMAAVGAKLQVSKERVSRGGQPTIVGLNDTHETVAKLELRGITSKAVCSPKCEGDQMAVYSSVVPCPLEK